MSLITTGHGYANAQPEYGITPDPIFSDYTVVLHPIPERENRVIHNTCYRSYDIRLAVENGRCVTGSSLYLLINHGGGSETWKLDYRPQLLQLFQSMSDVDAYYMLWKLWNMASEARRDGIKQSSQQYSEAFIEGRLKKSRIKQGRRQVTIDPRPQPTSAENPFKSQRIRESGALLRDSISVERHHNDPSK